MYTNKTNIALSIISQFIDLFRQFSGTAKTYNYITIPHIHMGMSYCK